MNKHIDLSHLDTTPLDELMESQEFKSELENYNVDKCHLGGKSILKEDLIEYRKNHLANYGIYQ